MEEDFGINNRDSRRKKRYERQKERFAKHVPRTQKDSHQAIDEERKKSNNDRRSRAQNQRLAEQTLQITQNTGKYRTLDGTWVDINQSLRQAIDQTITYTPITSAELSVSDLISRSKGKNNTSFTVELETTLAACLRITEEEKENNFNIAALNFASAKNPGGGFLNGSMAQEESLALSSGLFDCINGSEMYPVNRANPNRGLYQNYMIFSPKVPVFRNDHGDLLKHPVEISFLTVPAVNVGDAQRKEVEPEQIEAVTRERMDRMLAMAVWHEVEVLILGSWGCGVFKGNAQLVFRMFINLLTSKYEGVFRKVVFSTTDENHVTILEKVLDDKFGVN